MKVLIKDNPVIESFFFLGSDEAPVEEFKYVVKNKMGFSFLDEINQYVQDASVKGKLKNVKTGSARDMAHNFGRFVILSTVGIKEEDDQKVKEALECLRDILTVARDINSL